MDELAQYQSDLLNLLLGDPALAVVPGYKYKDFVIADVAAQAVAFTDRSGLGKMGCAFEVRMPAIRAKYPDLSGPQLQLEFTIRCMEDPTINKSGLTCEGVGMEVLRWLEGQIIEGGRTEGITLIPDTKGQALKPVYDYPDRFCYDAVFVAEFPQDNIPRANLPGLAEDHAGTVTLTTSDASQVFYTVDGSMPIIPVSADAFNPAVAQAPTFLYAAPFLVQPGTTVRWLAWQPNYRASFIGKAIINIP